MTAQTEQTDAAGLQQYRVILPVNKAMLDDTDFWPLLITRAQGQLQAEGQQITLGQIEILIYRIERPNVPPGFAPPDLLYAILDVYYRDPPGV